MNLLNAVFGIWLTIDGFGSIIKYRKQSMKEHAVRLVRAVVGLILLFLSSIL
jgi:succinate dehydrogenase/fumarate reductase cytochrome b subunit